MIWGAPYLKPPYVYVSTIEYPCNIQIYTSAANAEMQKSDLQHEVLLSPFVELAACLPITEHQYVGTKVEPNKLLVGVINHLQQYCWTSMCSCNVCILCKCMHKYIVCFPPLSSAAGVMIIVSGCLQHNEQRTMNCSLNAGATSKAAGCLASATVKPVEKHVDCCSQHWAMGHDPSSSSRINDPTCLSLHLVPTQ